MSSPFSQFLSKTDTSLTLAENEHFLAVLEANPLVLGHVVVIAKREVDDLLALEDQELASLLIFSKRIAQAISAQVKCEKVGVAALGLQTRHAHLHLVPVSTADDLNFTREKLKPTREVLLSLAKSIKSSF